MRRGSVSRYATALSFFLNYLVILDVGLGPTLDEKQSKPVCSFKGEEAGFPNRSNKHISKFQLISSQKL